MQSFKEFIAEQNDSQSCLNEDDIPKHVKIYGFGGQKTLEDVFDQRSDKVGKALLGLLYNGSFGAKDMERLIAFLNKESVEKTDIVNQWTVYHTRNKIDYIKISGALIEMTLSY